MLDLGQLLKLLVELLRVVVELLDQKTMSLSLLAVLLRLFSPADDSNELISVLIDDAQLSGASGYHGEVGGAGFPRDHIFISIEEMINLGFMHDSDQSLENL
jgi:hypothetical protein